MQKGVNFILTVSSLTRWRAEYTAAYVHSVLPVQDQNISAHKNTVLQDSGKFLQAWLHSTWIFTRFILSLLHMKLLPCIKWSNRHFLQSHRMLDTAPRELLSLIVKSCIDASKKIVIFSISSGSFLSSTTRHRI